MVRSKKAALSELAKMILAIASLIILLVLIVNTVVRTNTEARVSICQANMNIATSIRDADTRLGTGWVVSGVGRTLVEHNLCATVTKTIRIEGRTEDEINKNTAIAIGEMIQNCWRQFGEGKIYNVFQQSSDFFERNTNYYFVCYRFKLEFPDNFISYELPISNLVSRDGYLWRLNLQGRLLSGDYQDIYQKYSQGDRLFLTYGGYVEWDGYGYLEFVKSVPHSIYYRSEITRSLWDRLNNNHPLSTIRPGTGPILDVLQSSEYYEVRFYSPVAGDVLYDHQSFIINNIKITPAWAESYGAELEGTSVNE